MVKKEDRNLSSGHRSAWHSTSTPTQILKCEKGVVAWIS